MPEFLHQIVERRERSVQNNSSDSVYNLIIQEMNQAYTMGWPLRAQENINRYMDTQTPTPGMTLVMPVMDMNARANARLVSTNMTYMYTGNLSEGFRGWVRTN